MVFGIVLGILIIILMPIAAVLALFNGTLEFDTARLQEMIVQNLTAEQKAQMQAVEETMYAIQDAMIVAGFCRQDCGRPGAVCSGTAGLCPPAGLRIQPGGLFFGEPVR